MKTLTEENDYRSPKRKPALIARISPGLGFYTQVMSVVWKAAHLAKRGKYHAEEWVRSSRDIVSALESVGATIHVENLDAFRHLDAPCVFIGNHMSTLETFVLPCLIRPYREVTFIVKQSLIDYPVFKHVMRSRDPIVVGRTNPREDLKAVLDGGKERLDKGISVIVFPQRTRAFHTHVENFNSIGVKLAKNADVPVVPLALRSDAWGNGKRIKDIGKIDPKKPIHICFGEPVRVRRNGREEHEHIVRFINTKLEEWFQP